RCNMAASSRRTVISGIGTLNALGQNVASVWDGFLQGRCGIRPIRNFDASGLPVRIAGEVPDFRAKDLVAKEVRKSLKMMARTIELAVCAGQLALGEACRILEREGADFFLVGGTESKINPLSMVRQCLFEPLSKRNEEPEKACRPFDRRRDGLVLGEGGTVLVVEDLQHARK